MLPKNVLTLEMDSSRVEKKPIRWFTRFSGGSYSERPFPSNAYATRFSADPLTGDYETNTAATVASIPFQISFLPSFIPDPLKDLYLSFSEGNQTSTRGSETFSDFILHAAITGITVKTMVDNDVSNIPSFIVLMVWAITSYLFSVGLTSYQLSEKNTVAVGLKFVLSALSSCVAGILPALSMYLPSMVRGSATGVPYVDGAFPLIKPWYLILYLHAIQLNNMFDKQNGSLLLSIPLIYYLANSFRWPWLIYMNDPYIMSMAALTVNYFMTIPRKVHPDHYLAGVVEAPRKHIPPNHDLTLLNGLLYFGLQLCAYKGVEFIVTYAQAMWNA